METYVAGVVEELPSPLTIKVHGRMCSELLNLVVIVSKVIPEIEAARPRASGIEALSSLVNAISKAKSLLQHCSESSVLYLVLTGDLILSSCNETSNLLEQCLNQIQKMVPLSLADKISGIILALRRAAFCLDPPEEKAGKVLREMLHKYGSIIDPTEDFALSAIHAVCSQLHISSQKALVIERRSIKKQLDKVNGGKQSTRKILCLFLHLLNKYQKVAEAEQMDNSSAPNEDSLPFASSHDLSWKDSSNSSGSLDCFTNDLNLPSDFSSISLGSSQDSDPLSTKIINSVNPSCEICALPLDSTCNAFENVRKLLKISDESWSMMPLQKLIELLLRFLRKAHDLGDMEARMAGCLYLLELVQKLRNITSSYMKEDAYSLLASFLDTEIAKPALSVLEVLSFHQHCGFKIAASGALVRILIILENQVQELLEPALNILSNLCANSDIGSYMAPSDLIPKLVPLFETNATLGLCCVTILKKLCDNREYSTYIAGSDGCITSIAKLLENGSHVEQENAVSILHSLCSHKVQYSQLLMDEGVIIPGLFDVSRNGNKKAKAVAAEVIQILEGKSTATGERYVKC